jgi:hypothetical protein
VDSGGEGVNWEGIYVKAVIANIQYGKGSHADTLYAEIRCSETNELLVAATLDYCVNRMTTVAKMLKTEY